MLHNNPEEGIQVANQSLVLQNVSRSRAGFYKCVGRNQVGDGESNQVSLDIKCKLNELGRDRVARRDGTENTTRNYLAVAPVCRPGQRDVYSAARGEILKVLCELEANPTNVNITWRFNGTNAENIDIPTSHIRTERTKSTAKYVPNSEQVSRVNGRTFVCKMQYNNNSRHTCLSPSWEYWSQLDDLIVVIIPGVRPFVLHWASCS